MQTKCKFAEPTIEVVMFSEQDIVTTSGGFTGEEIPGGGIALPEVPME